MIVGICGRMGHGKTTLSQMLEDGSDGIIIPMASVLKGMAACLGLSNEQLYGSEKEVPDPRYGGKTPREIMQTLGTEWGRNMICPDIWTNAWKDKAENCLDIYDMVICDDVRFPNEVQAIREMGGIIIAVERPGAPKSENAAHASEQLDFEALEIPIILNDGTKVELYQKARAVIRCHSR